jgi:thioredoxin reductase
MKINNLPVAIIGGGAVGLAAAAHLVKNKQPFILFETGETVGTNILNWGHVKVFSPWKYNIDKAAEELLLQTEWQSPDKESLHTGKEFYDNYFTPLANHPSIKPFIHTNSKVIAVGRKGMDKMKTNGRENQPFVLKVQEGQTQTIFEAKAIIDASGTWHNGNPIGAGGLFAAGETENANKIVYGIPDVLGHSRDRYKNKSVVVVGGGHSAINTILELDKLKEEFPDTQIHWILRKEKVSDVYGGKEDDALPARGALGIKIEKLVNEDRLSVYTPFHVQEIKNENERLTLFGTQHEVKKALRGIDEIVSNTGTRPDYSFLREVRVDFDSTVESVPALADLIDPNQHSCGTVRAHGELELKQREKDFYIVGMKSYGRAPTFLMATGYEQVRSVVAALVGDFEAAHRVELDLPQTGVCNSDRAGACCGTETADTKLEAVCCQ